MTDQILSATLKDGDTSITVLSMGCAIQDWSVAGKSVVLGYQNPEAYRSNPYVLGCIVGRIANRTADAGFELDGQHWTLPANDGAHHIHGGPGGLAWCNWDLTQESSTRVILRLRSEHLAQGYPGAVDFEVRLTLNGSALTWDMTAKPDRPTPINLAQHVYFNLDGSGDVLSHKVQLNASKVTLTDAKLIPTGKITHVGETRFDFRNPVRIRDKDPESKGYDVNFALDRSDQPDAQVHSDTGMQLRLWTNRPGLQFYTAKHLNYFADANSSAEHKAGFGFCLEAQDFPNAANQPGFGSIICTPQTPYHQRTTIEISPFSG